MWRQISPERMTPEMWRAQDVYQELIDSQRDMVAYPARVNAVVGLLHWSALLADFDEEGASDELVEVRDRVPKALYQSFCWFRDQGMLREFFAVNGWYGGSDELLLSERQLFEALFVGAGGGELSQVVGVEECHQVYEIFDKCRFGGRVEDLFNKGWYRRFFEEEVSESIVDAALFSALYWGSPEQATVDKEREKFVEWKRGRFPELYESGSVIVMVAGRAASGKGGVARVLAEYGFKAPPLSDRVRELAAALGNEEPYVRETLIKIGHLAREIDPGALLQRAVVMNQEVGKPLLVAFEGLRTGEEAGAGFAMANEGMRVILIAVEAAGDPEADAWVRFRRVLKRAQETGRDTDQGYDDTLESFEQWKREQDEKEPGIMKAMDLRTHTVYTHFPELTDEESVARTQQQVRKVLEQELGLKRVRPAQDESDIKVIGQ